MDYTDIYLRQRRKDDGSTSIPHIPSKCVETEKVSEPRVERMLKGAFSVQELIDRIENLSTRVDAFDEKMVNLTKLVKIAQGLQEEKETDLRRQQHELRSRLKRQEQISSRLQEELDNIREKISYTVKEAIIEARQEGMNEMLKVSKIMEEQFNQLKLEIENSINNIQKEFEQKFINLQKEISNNTTSQLETHCNIRERLCLIEKSLQNLENSTLNDSSKFSSFELNIRQITESLNLLQNKFEINNSTIINMEEEKNKMQNTFMNEIESTRQWATRNLQRVKQHVEVISTDVLQLKNEQSDISSRLNRVSCQAEIEYKKLRTLLLQKAKEADTLCSIVGKELGKVEDMAERHQSLRTDDAAYRALKNMAF